MILYDNTVCVYDYTINILFAGNLFYLYQIKILIFNRNSVFEVTMIFFCTHFMNLFSFSGVLYLGINFCKMLRACLVCVICNSNSFHS